MTARTTKVDKQMQKLEQLQVELFDLISSMASEDYHKQPKPEEWSIAQAANHVFMSESLSLAYLRKKIAYPESIPPFHIKSWATLLALKFSFYSPVKFKAPKVINMWEDQPVLSPKELMEQWTSIRIDLFEFIHNHQKEFGSHLVFKHPIAGRLTLYQMLIFMKDHMHRHLRQIERISRDI